MKKLKTISLLILLIFIGSVSIGQTRKNNTWAAMKLEGKTFSVNIYTPDAAGKDSGNGFPDELLFAGGKFSSRKMGKLYHYKPDTYTCFLDSTKGPGVISFVAFSLSATGEMDVFWKGTLTGNSIEGTMHWFSHGQTNVFSGGLKYEGEPK